MGTGNNYLILSVGYNIYNKNRYETIIFTKDRQYENSIGRGELFLVNYIKATYIENKPYVLLSGNYHSESYD